MLGFIYFIGILYAVAAIFLWLSLRRKRTPAKKGTVAFGSLIICAREEEENLSACLDSVENQSISSERLEIILVNDASRDRTGEIIDEFAVRSRFDVQVLHLAVPEADEPAGKWRALKEGISVARNDAFLLTDADAILPPSWAERHLQELADADMSAGFALIAGDSAWSKVQNLDWLYILGSGAATAARGLPLSALGKNLSLRREAHDKIGGFEKIGFSVTEDLALVQAVIENNGTLAFPIERDMCVTTPGVPNWRDFIRQRQRWIYGLRHLNVTGVALLLLMLLRNVAIIIGIFFTLGAALWIWVLTALLNFAIQQQIHDRLGLPLRLTTFVIWELFYTWTSPLQAIQILTNRSIHWKGRTYNKTKGSTA
jgi:cellulose synthase/poly-beta-1,6-N-acetylglucosamine synthase-like glycosyltransferase